MKEKECILLCQLSQPRILGRPLAEVNGQTSKRFGTLKQNPAPDCRGGGLRALQKPHVPMKDTSVKLRHPTEKLPTRTVPRQ